MINLELLRKRGVSAESWREKFSSEENRVPTFSLPGAEGVPAVPLPGEKAGDKESPKPEEKVFKGINLLRNRIRLRIQAGREWNLQHYQMFKALDDALDVPIKRAVTPTMLQMLCDKTGTEESLKGELKAWGFSLDDVVLEAPDAKVDGKNARKISAPAFFQVFVPLVKAYLTIRRAKIMNDMNVSPFFEYQPAWESARTRLQCDVITSRVEVMNQQFSYYDAVNESVFQMLHYGRSYAFTREEWYSEEQEVEDESQAVRETINGTSQPLKNKKERYYRVTREGLRYYHPPPSRTFVDQVHAPSTLNTDTGCEFAGYWRILPYKDVLDNPNFFNKDRIAIGNYGWYGSYSTFFSTVYPCQLAFPNVQPTENNRESTLLNTTYSRDMSDKAVVITEYREKLIPSDFDLGDYDYPVWARFVVGGDDTVLYAAPLPYAPVLYAGYDEDQQRSQNASLSLEILPFQDHLSNLLTQYLLSVKQNLANLTFVNEDLIKKPVLEKLKNLGEKLFRVRNFVPFSEHATRRFQQQNVATAFYSHSFPQMDTNGIIQAIKMTLDICERVLGLSSQELGQAASHEQTKKEVDTITSQTSTRLEFTRTPVIQLRHSMMRQLYAGLMAYGQEDFWGHVAMDRELDKAFLESIGFTVSDLHPMTSGSKRLVVRTKKTAVDLVEFCFVPEGQDRKNNVEAAALLFQSLAGVLANPSLFQAIGARQAIELIGLIGKIGGWPRDFKLRDATPDLTPEAQSKMLQEQLAPFIGQIEQKIMGEVKGGITPILQRLSKDEEALAHVSEILQMVQGQGPRPGVLNGNGS